MRTVSAVMSLYQVQKLLFQVFNDLDLRPIFRSNRDKILAGLELTDPERQALRAFDVGALYRMGVNPYLLFQVALIVGMKEADYVRELRGR